MVTQIYSTELELNKFNSTDTEAAFLDFNLSLLTVLFLLQFMTNVIILILTSLISHFWMATFLVPPLMVLYFPAKAGYRSV